MTHTRTDALTQRRRLTRAGCRRHPEVPPRRSPRPAGGAGPGLARPCPVTPPRSRPTETAPPAAFAGAPGAARGTFSFFSALSSGNTPGASHQKPRTERPRAVGNCRKNVIFRAGKKKTNTTERFPVASHLHGAARRAGSSFAYANTRARRHIWTAARGLGRSQAAAPPSRVTQRSPRGAPPSPA